MIFWMVSKNLIWWLVTSSVNDDQDIIESKGLNI